MAYLVTAKHVVKGIKGKGLDDVFIRFNSQKNSTMYLKTKAKEWIFHDDITVDIAIHPFNLNREKMDHLAFPESLFLTDSESTFTENEIGVKDEVFIAGLFKHHHGKNKNLPIIRVGNIAALPDEKVQCKDHKRDAYLIEAHQLED